jgi:hypothetical protein
LEKTVFRGKIPYLPPEEDPRGPVDFRSQEEMDADEELPVGIKIVDEEGYVIALPESYNDYERSVFDRTDGGKKRVHFEVRSL